MTGEHLALGRFGEGVAVQTLERKGYTILGCNWIHGRGEIDIVAALGSTLVFVEVKTRRDNPAVTPELAVDWKKQRQLRYLGRAYLSQGGGRDFDAVRFDVVAVTVTRAGAVKEVEHFEDAF